MTTENLTVEQLESSAAMLKAQLAEIEARKSALVKTQREAVKPEFRYTIKPSAKAQRMYRDLYDDAVMLYTIEGHLVNEEAIRAVGGQVPTNGSMTYYFNGATGKLITATGGGTVYLKKSREQWDEVSAFIVAHPKGGDITESIEKYRHVSAW